MILTTVCSVLIIESLSETDIENFQGGAINIGNEIPLKICNISNDKRTK